MLGVRLSLRHKRSLHKNISSDLEIQVPSLKQTKKLLIGTLEPILTGNGLNLEAYWPESRRAVI